MNEILNFIMILILACGFSACGQRHDERKKRSSGEQIGDGLTPAEENGKYGFINSAGQFVIAPQFEEVKYFSEGKAMFGIRKDGEETLYGFINTDGKVVIEPTFSSAGSFSNGYAVVTLTTDKTGSFGYIDETGELVIPPKFFHAEAFVDDIALVEVYFPPSGNGSLYGYIDKRGKYIVEPRFSNARSFSEGLAAVQIDGLWGFINKKSEQVIPARLKYATSFSQGLAAVCEKVEEAYDPCGYMDQTGRLKIPSRFARAESFREDLAIAGINNKYGFIDKSGQFVIPPEFFVLDNSFYEGLASVRLPSASPQSYGYIDKTGKVVIAPEYSTAGNFINGLAQVEIYEGQRGEGLFYRTAYINHFGKRVRTGEEFFRPVGRH